jgi:hypothetical protein
MELDIKCVPTDASRYEVTKVIAAALHNESEFPKLVDAKNSRKLNFQVTLNEGCGGLRNNGHGMSLKYFDDISELSSHI